MFCGKMDLQKRCCSEMDWFERIWSSDLGPFVLNSEMPRFHSKLDSLYRNFDPKVIKPPKTYADILNLEKIKCIKKVKTSILSVRQLFLDNYARESAKIDEIMEKMRVYLKSREMELKAELVKIGQTKLAAWDKQMKVLDEAVQMLEGGGEIKKELLDDAMSSVGFVDAGDVKVEFDDLTVFRVLQKLGRISSSNESPLEEQTVKLQSIAPKIVIGKSGDGEGEFCRPWGVCADRTGRILVADRSNHRIQVFNESGNFVFGFGKKGSEPGEFLLPSGVAVDNMCHIIVADKDNHRIQVFTYNGSFLFTFGKQGSGSGEFCYPWDVASNSKCQIAVSDTKNHRVQLFDSRGNYLTEIGSYRRGLKRLDCPRGLAFRSDDSLLLTDFNNHRVVFINPEFTAMKFFGREGNKQGELFRPQGITCDSQGRFAVSDCRNYRIQVFDNKGNLCKVFGTQGASPGQFDCPQGICYHPNGSLIVVDLGNSRVQVF